MSSWLAGYGGGASTPWPEVPWTSSVPTTADAGSGE